MKPRTLVLEIGVAEHEGRDLFWVQQRWSDGLVKPIGIPYDSKTLLLADADELLAGEPFDVEDRVVRMPRFPLHDRAFID